jgi:hypothetical protein
MNEFDFRDFSILSLALVSVEPLDAPSSDGSVLHATVSINTKIKFFDEYKRTDIICIVN